MNKRKFIKVRNAAIYLSIFLLPFILFPIFGATRIVASIGIVIAIILFIVSKLVERKYYRNTDKQSGNL